MADFKCPQLIRMADYNNDFDLFFEAVYRSFCSDFITNKPNQCFGKRLGLKKYPLRDEKEATFYHLTHEGADEENRNPCLRRCERIRFPKELINQGLSSDDVLVWKSSKGRVTRIKIFALKHDYLFILDERKDYILPWTAYLVEYPNKKRRLIKEYEDQQMA